MKLHIQNMNYVWAGDNRLIPFTWQTDKPWTFACSSQIHTFPTHAEAIAYADELARGLREVP